MERENSVAYFLAFGLFCFHVAFIHIKTGENWRINRWERSPSHEMVQGVIKLMKKLDRTLLDSQFHGQEHYLVRFLT